MRVLIVDDDAGIRETLGVMLRDEGYDVEEATNGADALRKMWTASDPTVVLLDMWMPQMSGEETLVAAEAHPALWNRLAFIVITANPRRLSERAQALLARTGIPLLVKPFDIDALEEAVRAAANSLASANGSRA
ncbi:MAG: response regulator [Chloroflexota bacterium]|nr:response regulator [Chloroflexota bacterium]